MDIVSEVNRIADEAGFSEIGYVEIEGLKYYREVRQICEGNTCRSYATSWACPPAFGTLEECKARVEQYDKMLLFSQIYKIEDSFDLEGMVEGMRSFKKTVDRFHQSLQNTVSDFLLLSNEGCGRCAQCTYPCAPCRFPQLLHHSLEGYGFIVSELARAAGIRYNNGSCTVTYFGALLFNDNGFS